MKKMIDLEYVFPKNFKINWFPGHMARTYRILPEQIKKIDIFLEIRDSRIPISSGNSEIENLLTDNIRRIILFNKYDLCDQNKTHKTVEKYLKESPNIALRNCKYMYLSAKTQLNVKKIIEMIIRENNPKFKTVGTWCMVGGIPNVGKSTIINTFKNMNNDSEKKDSSLKKSAKTDIHATTTRHIDYFKINNEPVVYIMDTPGIMPPKIYNVESGIKLAIAGNIKDKITGKEIICDYLLFCLNKSDSNQQSYVKRFKLKGPVYTGEELVASIMQQFFMSSNNAMDFIIKNFREGSLGKITFDENIPHELIYTVPK